MTSFIAERKLLYSLNGNEIRNEFTVGISAPYVVRQDMVNFTVGEGGCYGCQIGVIGLNEKHRDVYGADSLQAINIASNAIEPFLKGLNKKYDLFYLSGETYFDDSDES